MDGQIRKRHLIDEPRPKPRDTTPQKMFQHFASEAERQRFLEEVRQAQKDGSVPF